jgi:hypothetical protein
MSRFFDGKFTLFFWHKIYSSIVDFSIDGKHLFMLSACKTDLTKLTGKQVIIIDLRYL